MVNKLEEKQKYKDKEKIIEIIFSIIRWGRNVIIAPVFLALSPIMFFKYKFNPGEYCLESSKRDDYYYNDELGFGNLSILFDNIDRAKFAIKDGYFREFSLLTMVPVASLEVFITALCKSVPGLPASCFRGAINGYCGIKDESPTGFDKSNFTDNLEFPVYSTKITNFICWPTYAISNSIGKVIKKIKNINNPNSHVR